MKRKLVYCAGPLTRGDLLQNTRDAMMLWNDLWSSGVIAPICPHWSVYQQILTPIQYEEWMEFDFEIIDRCDSLYRWPGDSPGGDREVKHALSIPIPVFYSIESVLEWARRG